MRNPPLPEISTFSSNKHFSLKNRTFFGLTKMCLLWVGTVSKQLVWQFRTFYRPTASSTSAKPRDGPQRFEPSWAGRPFFAKPSESYARQYEPYPSLATDSSSNGLFAFYASPFYARNARKMLEIIKTLPSGRGGFLVGYPHPAKKNPHPQKIPGIKISKNSQSPWYKSRGFRK